MVSKGYLEVRLVENFYPEVRNDVSQYIYRHWSRKRNPCWWKGLNEKKGVEVNVPTSKGLGIQRRLNTKGDHHPIVKKNCGTINDQGTNMFS